MRTSSSPPTDLLSTVDRALTVLETVGRTPNGLSIKEITNEHDLTAHTARHHATTLAYRGYLTRWDDTRYTLGPAIADRVHELALQLNLHYRTGTTTAVALATHLNRPAELVYRLLSHGSAAAKLTCPCAPTPTP